MLKFSTTEVRITNSEQETFELARDLGSRLQGREVVLLVGELGAGKTVFSRGLAAGLGIEDITEVCSPSFTLVNVYQARVPVYHMDLYRLEKKSDIQDLGWEDFLDQGVLIIEWAEKLNYEGEAIYVHIRVGEGDERFITVAEPPASTG
ncbi:MAG: tRNA (adenosine(37)-N6)-threonylcarbamoyltransferase complex ATPase subunit type 1 TsaE [Candidatus Aminicenantaceae bacterium]